MQVWNVQQSLNMKKDIRKFERIQKSATRMVLKLKELIYKDRMKEMGQATLQNRRERDHIILYKVVNGTEKNR